MARKKISKEYEQNITGRSVTNTFTRCFVIEI